MDPSVAAWLKSRERQKSAAFLRHGQREIEETHPSIRVRKVGFAGRRISTSSSVSPVKMRLGPKDRLVPPGSSLPHNLGGNQNIPPNIPPNEPPPGDEEEASSDSESDDDGIDSDGDSEDEDEPTATEGGVNGPTINPGPKPTIQLPNQSSLNPPSTTTGAVLNPAKPAETSTTTPVADPIIEPTTTGRPSAETSDIIDTSAIPESTGNLSSDGGSSEEPVPTSIPPLSRTLLTETTKVHAPTGSTANDASPLPTNPPNASADASNNGGSSVSPDVEKILISIGAIGGALLIVFGLWFWWKRRRRQHQLQYDDYTSRAPSEPSIGFVSAWNRMKSAVRRIPVIDRYFETRGWVDITGQRADDAFSEKTGMNSMSFFGQHSHRTDLPIQGGTAVGAPGLPGHAPKPSMWSVEANPTLDPAAMPPYPRAARTSANSDLSSGFGDGDIVLYPNADSLNSPRAAWMPRPPAQTLNANAVAPLSDSDAGAGARAPARLTTLSVPETTVTEVSEESHHPRFRTVTSWVRQQSVRTKRSQRGEQHQGDGEGAMNGGLPPPEQDLGLMASDGQEPRKAGSVGIDSVQFGLAQ